MFERPFWSALKTEHAGLAIGSETALRYPAEVLPFAGSAEEGSAGMVAIRELLAPGETVYVTGTGPAKVEGLDEIHQLLALQMHFSGEVEENAADGAEIVAMGEAEAPLMVRLTDIAFPGFFRPRTHTLGSYFGVFVDGKLVSMAGERLAVPGHREISAVCTHPGHTGRGYAAALIRHLLRVHAAAGVRSYLHVTASNERAIDLYLRLGFTKTRPMPVRQLKREDT